MALSNIDTAVARSAAPKECQTRLLRGASVEILARDTAQIEPLAALLPRGMPVFVPALPNQPLAQVLDAARSLAQAGFEPVPHLAARKLTSAAELELFLRAITAESRVRRVMLIAGDIPTPLGPYADSLAVLRDPALSNAGLQEILLAGYPEGHPEIANQTLESALAEKIALARAQQLRVSLVTQFSFAPMRIVEWCSQLARQYPGLPIHVGIAGPTDPVALLKYAQRCGVSASRRALRHLGTGIARLVVNTDPADQITALAQYCEGKAACNVVGVHFFSFGGALKTARWLSALGKDFRDS